MNITVYLGANEGNDPALGRAVWELGRWIGESGHTLVYGGSKTGLMGDIARSVLETGGEVIGVEPQFFMDAGFQYDGLTELIVAKDMAERKTKMIQLGDAFIAFPGGTGTLEEIAEVMSKVSLKQLDAPCILYNLNGYYDDLKALLRRSDSRESISQRIYSRSKRYWKSDPIAACGIRRRLLLRCGAGDGIIKEKGGCGYGKADFCDSDRGAGGCGGDFWGAMAECAAGSFRY